MPKLPILEVRDLKKYYPLPTGRMGRKTKFLKAVDGVSLSIDRAETFGLVGESGCGKTTVGQTILRLIEPTAGEIVFRRSGAARSDGDPEEVLVHSASGKELRTLRKCMQIVFQDPYSSLNPRMTVGEMLREPLRVHGIARGTELDDRVRDLLDSVGLSPDHLECYPHEFSGGQRQRIGIARALALKPEFIVADEAVSALDVSIQAQILNLLKDLQTELDLTFLFIAHNLSVMKYFCNRLAVMYLGKIVESCKTEELFSHPLHPYTEALISSIPVPDPDRRASRIVLEGDVPDPIDPPSGCPFRTRCRYARPICRSETPEYREQRAGHFVACHLADALHLSPL